MYGFEKPMRSRFNGGGYPSVVPSYMMMYPFCPAEGSAPPASFGKFGAPGDGAAVFPGPSFGYPVGSLVAPKSVGQEESTADGGFEVHDSHLKAPVAVLPNVVYPSVGSQRLFNSQQPACLGTRCVYRICEPFQEGKCVLGEGCNDIHVFPDFLSATRQKMISWLQSKENEFKNTLMQDPQTIFRVFCADLKEVVEVPTYALRFTKGLYVDHAVRARRVRGVHQNQFAAMAPQIPTACGLFSVDPVQCKWGRWCNQVHIEATWMKTRKSEFELWSNSLEERFKALSPGHKFTVHDPHLKTSLILPKVSIADFSRGLFQGTAKKAPSVCMLYQRNRCTANSCCNQVHVVPAYLNLYRRWVSSDGRMPEEERRWLENELEAMYQSFVSQLPAARASFSEPQNSDGVFVELSPQTVSQVAPTPTNKSKEKVPESVDTPLNPSNLFIPRSPSRNTQQQFKSPSANDGSAQRNKSFTGFVMPLGELVANFDGEEQSQSSLQASQSNGSPAAQSYRHSNNPYAVNGSASCTATPSFGWVQPIRSAGNSVTTVHAASCVGFDRSQGGEYGGSRGAGGKQPFSACVDSRLKFLGSQMHDFDANMNSSSSPIIHFNASSSINFGSRVEQYRVGNSTPEG